MIYRNIVTLLKGCGMREGVPVFALKPQITFHLSWFFSQVDFPVPLGPKRKNEEEGGSNSLLIASNF
jgi:hypothetical protein